MNFLQQALSYIFTAANWGGPAGLTARIAEHLQYTVVAVLVSVLVAVPIGMLIGHTGRGTFLVVTGSMRFAHCPRWVCCCWACCCGALAWCRRRWR